MLKRVIRHEVEQPQDQSIKLIPLTYGVNAIVDTRNYGYLSQWPWFAYYCRSTDSFYPVRNVALSPDGPRQITQRMHRVVLGLDPRNPAICDHINGNTLDNRAANLRIVNTWQSAKNRRTIKRTVSKRCGVTRDPRGRWMVRITIDGKRILLGYRWDLDEAIKLREAAEIKFWGEYRRQ